MRFVRLIRRTAKHLQHLIVLAVFAISATPAYSASKTLVVLGDSLSAEYGLARGKGWVALLEKRLQEKKMDTSVINASISGDTTSGGKARFAHLLEKFHPDVVIVELGGNDALRGLSLNASEANFKAIIEMAQAKHAKVLLVGMRIPPNYGPDYSERFFSLYAKLAKNMRVPLVPFLLEGVVDNDALFQADRIHPLAEAHPTILNNVWPHLLPLLSK
ncbi:arylesterase [Undibacterium sp. TJN19]|uniref:arylesterase n=1 Tax=Undibacterium sp. TJN19 TaxID=3413055 RepID=UPI003BF01EAD